MTIIYIKKQNRKRQQIIYLIEGIYAKYQNHNGSCMSFKEIYCSDCEIVLAKYSTRYFTNLDIDMLVRSYFSSHIKNGHAIEIRVVDNKESQTHTSHGERK